MTQSNRRKFLRTAGIALATISQRQSSGHSVPNSNGKIKLGQLGVGHAHASKLSVYRASADYEVIGIVEPDASLRHLAEPQAAYRDIPWMTQEQLFNVPGLQVVLIETRVRDLLNAAELCINAGKHIHLDKPAGESLPQFERIMQSAAKQKLLVQMGYMYRYNPAVVLLRNFLSQGWLGDLFEVHAVMSKVINPASRRALAEYQGGTLFELGCHILDLVISILGKPGTVTSFNQHVSSQDDTLLDNMLAVLSYSRATATVKSSAQEVEGFARRHLVVCGTEGTFHIQPLDNPTAQIALAKPRGKYKTGYQNISFPKYMRYVADAADMARILRNEKEINYSYEHDLTVQRVLLEACQMPLD